MKGIATAVAAVVAAAVLAGAAQAAPTPQSSADARFEVYTGVVSQAQVGAITDLGVDRHELRLGAVPSAGGKARKLEVEVILSGRQADSLRTKGINLTPKKVAGQTVTQRATALAADGLEVFRPYAGAGGLKEEFEQIAAANPRLTKLVTIGQLGPGPGHRRPQGDQERARWCRTARGRRCSTSGRSTRASGSPPR